MTSSMIGKIRDKLFTGINRFEKIVEGWSRKRKILVLILVWGLIFMPLITVYTNIHRESKFAYYPELASHRQTAQTDWDVVIYPESSLEGDRYVIEVDEGETVYFRWRAQNYTDIVHVGQVNVYHRIEGDEEDVIRLEMVREESKGGNETWEGEKTFEQAGEVHFYFRVDKSDLPRYYNRASVIIEGGNLYEDVRTEPPPLINFYFILPALLSPPMVYGGYLLSFYIYFSFFILINALLIFYLFEGWDENKAFLCSLIFVANPISFYTLFQDTGVVVFTVMLPMVLIVKERKNLASILVGLGVITKIWSGFLIPAQWYDKGKGIYRSILSIITALVALLFFYLLWGSSSLWFIRFYGGVAEKSTLGGVSIWATLSRTGLVSSALINATMILILIGVLELFILYVAHKKGWDVFLVFTATLAIFLALYPKVHWEYYLILLPFMTFYAFRKAKLFSIFIGFITSLTLARFIRYLPSYPLRIFFTVMLSNILNFLLEHPRKD